jgi:hypothetical protein
MTDQEILKQLQKELKNDVTVEQSVKELYLVLVTEFSKTGFFVEFPDADLPEQKEDALRELATRYYIKFQYQHLY